MAFIELFTNISTISVILFIAAMILIIAEMFMPGFGVCGVIGVTLLIVDIFITAETVAQGLVLTVMCFVILVIILAVFLSAGSKGKLPKRLVLKEATSAELGFSGTEDMQYLLGKGGTVLTTCRPAGNADFDGVKLDVVSRGEYIEKGTVVEVIEVEGNKIVVMPKQHVNLA